jgi:hypothetical protein
MQTPTVNGVAHRRGETLPLRGIGQAFATTIDAVIKMPVGLGLFWFVRTLWQLQRFHFGVLTVGPLRDLLLLH